MQRRVFTRLLGGTAIAWPVLARAQPRPVIGFLSTRGPEEAAKHTEGFLKGLKEGGYVDGANVAITFGWARGRYDRLSDLAAELIAKGPAVLVAGGDPAAMVLKTTTTTTPIVFLVGDDPVSVGLVASLNRPAGNATGVSLISSALGGKRLELLLQVVPKARTVALLVNPTNPNAEIQARDVRLAASEAKRGLVVHRASGEPQLETVFSALQKQGVHGLVVQNDPYFDSRRGELIALAARYAIPSIYHIREFPMAGGLISYGPNLVDAYRELGAQTGRVLQGASPHSLPVVRPNTFETVVNIKTARTLDLTIPEAILLRADEVIE